jgi:hypothetical protein
MAALRDIALTVEERADKQFFWVILEAFNDDGSEAIHYSRIHIAATPQSTYASALVMGANALRKIADPGLASGSQGPA